MSEVINQNRVTGKPAQDSNIQAAIVLAGIVKTTLGPRGMDKMLVDAQGRVTVTNDGVTILEEMQIAHPAAKLIAEIAKTQEREIGDGTTTVTMLAGEFLKRAQSLIAKGIHPTVIIKGYRLAEKVAQDILFNNSVKVESEEVLKKIAQTAMTGKGAEGYREQLADLIVLATKKADRNNIKFAGMVGKSVEETLIMEGTILDREMGNEDMPKTLNNAIVGLFNGDLDVKNPEIDTSIKFSSFQEMANFKEAEEQKLNEYALKVINSGVGIIFCLGNINDKVLYTLANHGIAAVRRVNKFDLEMLSKTTGAKIVANINDLRREALGAAGRIREERVNDHEVRIFVDQCTDVKAVTILVHASTDHILKEITRAMTDGLGDVLASKDSRIVAGGGAIEIEVAKGLKQYAQTLKGREQLAVIEYAGALETIPETLAENSGLDAIESITSLRQAHDQGKANHGLNLFDDTISDTMNAGIIEPLKIKTQAISSATEVAIVILRVDDNLMSKDKQ